MDTIESSALGFQARTTPIPTVATRAATRSKNLPVLRPVPARGVRPPKIATMEEEVAWETTTEAARGTTMDSLVTVEAGGTEDPEVAGTVTEATLEVVL